MGDPDEDDGFVGCGEVKMDEEDEGTVDLEDEDEAASWLLLNPVKNNNNSSTNNNNNNNQLSNGFLFGGEVDEYLDLVDCNSCGDNNNNNNQFTTATDHYSHQHQQQQQYGVPQKSYVGDSVVPVRQHQQGQHFQLGLEFESPRAGFSYNGSVSQSVSFFFNCYFFCFLSCFGFACLRKITYSFLVLFYKFPKLDLQVLHLHEPHQIGSFYQILI